MAKLYKYCIFIILSLIIISCYSQVKNEDKGTNSKALQIANKEIKISLPENGFYCGFLDSKGNMWFGSRGSGVFKFDGKSFTNFTKRNGLCENDISCISEDSKGNLWFGTTQGVCRFNGKEFSNLEIPQSDTSSLWLDKVYPVVNPNQVMSILEDNDGNLWFGTNGAGVYRYDGNSFNQYLSKIGKVYEDGQQHNIVLSSVKDLKGNLWFTSLSHGGVSVYDGKQFRQYTDELSDTFVRTAFCDSKGNIWIGTHGSRSGGIDKFNGKEFTAFHKTNDGFSHNNVHWFHEDKSGKIWVASGINELATFDGQHFQKFKDKMGRNYDKIQFIISDSLNNLWFGNRYGLWKHENNEVIKMTQS